MSQMVGTRGQQVRDVLYDASVTIPTATKILVLPEMKSRSYLALQNLGSHNMWVQFGSALATASLSGTAVNSCSVTNAGFNFSVPPVIEFLGGGSGNNSQYISAGAIGFPSPGTGGQTGTLPAPGTAKVPRPAQAHCVMSGAVGSQTVSSIVVDDGGFGYVIAPYVFIRNSVLDPNGCADPSVSSGSGFVLQTVSSNVPPLIFNGTFCPTDSVAVFGTANDILMCKYAP